MNKVVTICILVAVVLIVTGSCLAIPLAIDGHKLNSSENQRAMIGIILLALAGGACFLGFQAIDNENITQQKKGVNK